MQKAVAQPGPPHRPLWPAIRQAALALLFTAILVIPRIRRLRRQAGVWTAIRAAAALMGACLIGEFARSNAGPGLLLPGIALVAAGIFIPARPQKKSLDELARELRSVVVLNGGAFISASGGKPIPGVSIFASAERFLALAKDERPCADIPVAGVRAITIQPVPQGSKPQEKSAAWTLEVHWGFGEVHTARFQYEGVFAEHLAGVAEKTLRNLWKTTLPVLV